MRKLSKIEPQSESTTRQRRNVRLHERRTSVSLENAIWDCLEAIGDRESQSTDQLATMINDRRQGSSLASSLRIFSLLYFRMLSQTYLASLQRRPMPGVQEEPATILEDVLDAFARLEAGAEPRL